MVNCANKTLLNWIRPPLKIRIFSIHQNFPPISPLFNKNQQKTNFLMCPLIVTFLNNVKYFWSTFWYTHSRNCCIFSCIFSRAKTVDSLTTLAMFKHSLHPKGQTTTANVFSKPFQSPSHDPFSERPNRWSGLKPRPKSLSQCYCAENQLHLVNFHLSNLNWTDPKAGAKPALPLLLVIGTSHSAFKQFLKFQLQPNFSTRNGEKTLLLILLSIVGKSDFSSKVLILIFKSSFPKSLEYFSVLLVFFHFS